MLKLYFDGNIPNHILSIIENINFEMSNFENSNYVISCKFYAETTNSPKIIQNNLNFYQNINKKIIVFLICDFADNFNIPHNVLLFRTSLYKSQRKYNEYLLPYVWEKIDKPFKLLKKTLLPIVGFCGRVDIYREKLINALQQNKNLTTNFIIRKDFWGGNPHNSLLINDFANNIESSHFTVCNRGNGNYSMRFYQVLGLGRIPLLVDSDLIFPFDNEINWHEIAIIGANEYDVINKLLDWWKNKDINAIQKKCKDTYDKYFNKDTILYRLLSDLYIDKFINNDFNVNIYNKYNDITHLNYSDLINHYINYGEKEGRIYKLPDDFNVDSYRKINSDLLNLNYEQLVSHYVNFGYTEKRNYK